MKSVAIDERGTHSTKSSDEPERWCDLVGWPAHGTVHSVLVNSEALTTRVEKEDRIVVE